MTSQVIVKLLKGMLDENEAAKLHDPDLYNHRYLSLKEPRLNDFFFDDVLNKDCGSLSVGKPLGGKGASRHFEAVCAAGYDVIHFREVHATEATRAKSGPKSAADLVTLLLRVEGGGSGKLLKSGAGIDALRGFLAGHRARIVMAFLTELKHNSKTQPQATLRQLTYGHIPVLTSPPTAPSSLSSTRMRTASSRSCSCPSWASSASPWTRRQRRRRARGRAWTPTMGFGASD